MARKAFRFNLGLSGVVYAATIEEAREKLDRGIDAGHLRAAFDVDVVEANESVHDIAGTMDLNAMAYGEVCAPQAKAHPSKVNRTPTRVTKGKAK